MFPDKMRSVGRPFVQWFSKLYFYWMVYTSTIMLEPWERRLFNIIAVSLFLIFGYTMNILAPVNFGSSFLGYLIYTRDGTEEGMSTEAVSVHPEF